MDELDQWRRIAGIVPQKPVQIVDRNEVMKLHDIKPGSKEYIDLYFPKNDLQMPAGFRGRKK